MLHGRTLEDRAHKPVCPIVRTHTRGARTSRSQARSAYRSEERIVVLDLLGEVCGGIRGTHSHAFGSLLLKVIDGTCRPIMIACITFRCKPASMIAAAGGERVCSIKTAYSAGLDCILTDNQRLDQDRLCAHVHNSPACKTPCSPTSKTKKALLDGR